jgi:hypothetical protein
MGLDVQIDHHAVINLAERRITLKINGDYTKFGFIGLKETTNKLGAIEPS